MPSHDWRYRNLAYDWHGGQSSPLYAYASTGAIKTGLLAEIIECHRLALASDERDAAVTAAALFSFADWVAEQMVLSNT